MYRTRTYLAGDWDGDSNLINKIKEWNDNGYLALDFTDAHALTQARDGSLNCTIKNSLAWRMNASKRFVLIVGDKTDTVTSGSCQYCEDYKSFFQECNRKHSVDLRSYVKYECEIAARDYRSNKIKVVVIYNFMNVYKYKCPEAVRNIGIHIPGIICDSNGNKRFDYQAIKNAIMS